MIPTEALARCDHGEVENHGRNGLRCAKCGAWARFEQAAEAADRETRCARCGLTRRFLYGDRLVEHDFHFGTNLNDGHAFIEQAAEAVDREDTESDAGSDATPSAAVAPLDVEALREQVYYLLFIYGQMDAEHGHWAAVRRMLNIDAAYADAIRKRGGA